MKRILILTALCMALAGAAQAKPLGLRGSFGVFYSSLAPYGEWIECDAGYVWRPLHVAQGWRPYMYGRWVWTSYGWYWVSSEPYGWATFHYGRWYYDNYYGWIWMPDDVWGPAWVEWRYDSDYIGWAPLSPYAEFSISFGIVYSHNWVSPVHYWNFVPCRNFTTARVVEYVQPVERTRRIFGNTRSAPMIRADGNRIVNGGVDVGYVERRANRHIDRIDVVQSERSDGDRIVRESSRERLEVYRPRLDQQTRTETERPSQVRRAERPISIERPTIDREAQREQLIHRGTDRAKARDAVRNPENPAPRDEQSGSSQKSVSPQRSVERPQSREEQIRDTHRREYFKGGTPQYGRTPQQPSSGRQQELRGRSSAPRERQQERSASRQREQQSRERRPKP